MNGSTHEVRDGGVVTRRRRVLLVDDDAAILEVVGMGLRLEGYEVVAVGNGREGLEWLGREVVDLVIADLMMPVMDGRAFLRALRGDLGLRVPVVVLTGVDDAEVVVEMEAEGACRVLRKPLELGALAGELAAIWASGGRRSGE